MLKLVLAVMSTTYPRSWDDATFGIWTPPFAIVDSVGFLHSASSASIISRRRGGIHVGGCRSRGI